MWLPADDPTFLSLPADDRDDALEKGNVINNLIPLERGKQLYYNTGFMPEWTKVQQKELRVIPFVHRVWVIIGKKSKRTPAALSRRDCGRSKRATAHKQARKASFRMQTHPSAVAVAPRRRRGRRA